MPTSDEDLQKMQSDTQKLRDQVDQAERDLLEKQRELANDTVASQLKNEQESLQARLAELKGMNTDKAVAEGAAMAIDPVGTAAKQEPGVVRSSTEEPDSSGPSPDSSDNEAAAVGATTSTPESTNKTKTKAGS